MEHMDYSHFLRHFHGKKYIRTMPVRRIFKTLSYLKIKTENNILEKYRILIMLGRYYL